MLNTALRQVPQRLGRFELGPCIGQGGFGAVFEAEDTRYKCRVALKLLRHDHALDVYRFKQEFRNLADLVHRNLVRFYELGTEDDAWYFTMELVHGRTFLSYVWEEPEPSLLAQVTQDSATPSPSGVHRVQRSVATGRLRAAVLELAEGLHALHQERKLHGDIKPSNVLVEEDGRVVLLDFGLTTDLDARDSRAQALGTPGYVAPELAERRQASCASDWFGVGALLHEALTGTTPDRDGPRFDRADPDNESLRLLCAELLGGDPLRRPDGREVLRRLREQSGPMSSRQHRLDATRVFVGRSRQLAELGGAWQRVATGHPVVARILGPSGAGKTALARHFLDGLRQREPAAIVLSGRCYEQESVPYKALDGLMDALGRHLALLTREQLELVLPPSRELLPRLFRAFEQTIEAGAEAAAPELLQAQRRRAFMALRELLQRLSATHKLVLCLDDLQWGDIDSARLLTELLRAPNAPAVLLLVSSRPVELEGFWTVFDEAQLGLDEERIVLGDLSAEESRALAGHLLGRDEEQLVAAIADEAGGSPIFIQQLALRVAPFSEAHQASLSQVIVERLQQLGADARQLVEAVALAGQPIDEAAALEAASLSGGAARAATLTVRKARLVSARGANYASVLEAVHDRVREAVLTAVSPEKQRDYHARLAAALLAQGASEPETLLRHFLGAGDDSGTREYASLAGERAERAFAFDRAAEHYALVLRLTPLADPGRWLLVKRSAEALEGAGRAAESAEAFQAAADSHATGSNSDPIQTLALTRRSGQLALRSGRFELGSERLDAVLGRLGITPPRSRGWALVVSLVKRLRLFVRGFAFRPRAAPEIKPEDLERLEALWDASTGVSMLNHVVADALGLEHLLQALALGERSHVVRGLGYEAAFEAVLGGRFMRRRCRKILDLMEALACESDVPYDHAWARLSQGVTSWFLGEWQASWENCDAAAQVFRERCHGVAWELAICDAYRLPALAYLGDLRKLADVVPHALQGARERGDLFAASMLRLGQQSMPLLADDRPEALIAAARDALAPFPQSPYLLPHYHHLFAVVQAELYSGRAEQSWRRIEQAWSGLKQSQLLMVQCLRVEIRHLRARTAIALAQTPAGTERARPSKAELWRAALAEARAIARDDVAPARPMAAAIRAAAARAQGKGDRAQSLLREALGGFEAAGMALYASAARDRLGNLLGGHEGAQMQRQAGSWMGSQQVKNVPALVAMLLPGL